MRFNWGAVSVSPCPFKGEVRWGMGHSMLGQTNKYILYHKMQRTLRNNMTDAERRLWGVLTRQTVSWIQNSADSILMSNTCLDFTCLEKKLVVEVDGGQHTEDTLRDSERT